MCLIFCSATWARSGALSQVRYKRTSHESKENVRRNKVLGIMVNGAGDERIEGETEIKDSPPASNGKH